MHAYDVRMSKKLSWLLRHGAGEEGLPMDPAGWVPVDAVLDRLPLSRKDLREMVEHNSKRRLQLVGERIRCCQGHSTETMPVTLDALEASWTRYSGEGPVWHGTNLDALDGIDAEGLLAVRRTHVHLADALESTVGKRSKVAVMLAVSPSALSAAGVPLWVAPNGVILTRRVPRACISGIRPISRRARARSDALHAWFGVA